MFFKVFKCWHFFLSEQSSEETSRIIKWGGMGIPFHFWTIGLTVSEKAVNCMSKFTEWYTKIKYNTWKKVPEVTIKIVDLPHLLKFKMYICYSLLKKSFLLVLYQPSHLFAVVRLHTVWRMHLSCAFFLAHTMVITMKSPESILDPEPLSSSQSELTKQ